MGFNFMCDFHMKAQNLEIATKTKLHHDVDTAQIQIIFLLWDFWSNRQDRSA